MSEIKMSYIIIEKQKHESKKVKDILLEIIDEVVESRTDDTIRIGKVIIRYRIKQLTNSKHCFLEMKSNARVNQSIPALLIINNGDYFKI